MDLQMFRVSCLYILKIFFTFLLITLACPLSYANEDKVTIKVGYDKGYGLIDNIDALDKKGFGYELLMRTEHYSNFRYEFIEYNYLDGLRALLKNEIDIMGIVLDDKHFVDIYDFVPKVLGYAQSILASKKEGIFYDNPDEINGKTVASFHNNPYEKFFVQYCKDNNISVNLIYGEFDDYTELDADFYLVTTIDANVKDFYMVMNLEVFPMYFIVNKDRQDLAQALVDAIDLSISADGRFLESLQLKYYGSKNLTRRYLTTDEISLLRSRPLTCGYIDHHQPIQYTNKENNPDGLSVLVMDMLAKKFGFEIQYFPYNHNMPNESHENFDMLISATGDYEHETAFYTASAPFLELPMMLFAKNEIIEDIVTKDKASVLGMINYITLDYTDVVQRYPNNTLKSYNTFDELMLAYSEGEIDGILATENGVEYAQAVLGEEEYSIRSTGLTLPLRVFLSNKLHDLTAYIGAFNVMFEHVGQSTIDEIMSMQSVSFLPKYSLETFLLKNITIVIIIALAIILFIGSIVFYYQYKGKKAILDIINYDDLTPLISLYNFTEKANKTLQSARINEYALISLDIDSFHTINKVYGREKGNLVIKAVAQSLIKCFKSQHDLIARIIADQFIVFTKNAKTKKAKFVCEEDVTSVIKTILGEKYNVSMSVGICIIEDCNLKINEIIDHAVAARLKGKGKYNFTYHMYDEAIKKEHEMTTSIVYRMKDALNNNEFKVVYQPKINLQSMKISGAEALVRWHSRNNGIMPPDLFISVFEANGFIVNLDLYVFEQVCKFIQLNQEKIDIPMISINMSAITLFDENFPHAYTEILSKYQLPASCLEIEVTESAITLDRTILVEKVKEINKLGFSLSIDDFGVGESSLNRLSSIEVDTIKLDKAFLDDNIAEEKGAIVVDNVIRMAKQLNMKVVSEGVETREQARWLESLNCDYAQGYYFERPMQEQNFIELLKSDKTYTIED